jgi:hypothetical protein
LRRSLQKPIDCRTTLSGKPLKTKVKLLNLPMDIDKQARESATTERQHGKLRESAMDARARAEVQKEMQTNDSISETAREEATSQRQAEEALEANMQRRAEDER